MLSEEKMEKDGCRETTWGTTATIQGVEEGGSA
jgi:hypothetical protein